jgi:O-antigen ligase
MILPLILYICWMSIAGVAAKNPGFALWGTMMRGTGLLTLYSTTLYTLIIASVSKRYDGYVYRLLGWVVGGGAVVVLSVWMGDEGFNAAIGVLQKGSGGGVTGNSTLAGSYLLFILGFTTFLLVSKQYIKKVWVWILSIGIMCSPIFLNIYGLLSGKSVLGSARGAFLGIIIAATVSVFVYWSLSLKKSVRILGVGGIVAGIAVFVVAWAQLMTPGTSIHQKFIESASGTRFAFWHISQQVLHERPLIGYGPENFSIAQARYFDPKFLSKDLAFEAWTDHPHNVYFDNGVAAGYPGIVLYCIFVGSLIVIVYRNKNLSSAQRGVLIGTLTAYIIQNLVAIDGFVTIFILAVYTGVIYGLSVSSIDVSVTKKQSEYPILLCVLLLFSCVGIYYFGYQPAHKAKLFGEVLASSLDIRSDRYKEFLDGSPVGTYWDIGGFGYDEYKLYAQNSSAVKNNQKVLPYAIKDVDAYIAYLEQVATTNKTDYRLYFTIINLYNTKIYLADLPYNQAMADHVTELIQYAQTLAPTDPRLYWLYAQLDAWKGDIVGVISSYQKAIAIDPTLPVSHRLLLQFLQGIGNQKLYKESLLYAQKEITGFTLQ